MLEWDVPGQLRKVTTNGAVATYGYDGSRRRIRRTDAGGTVRSVYAGSELFAETDGAGKLLRTHSVTEWSGETSSPTKRTLYYALESPGHVAGLFDGTHAAVSQYGYTPFGRMERERESTSQPLKYMARERDGSTVRS